LQIEFLADVVDLDELIETDYEILRLENVLRDSEVQCQATESEIRILLGQKEQEPISWFPYEEYSSPVALQAEKVLLQKGEKTNPSIAILRIQMRRAIDEAKKGGAIERKELQYMLEQQLLECQGAQNQYRSDMAQIYKKAKEAQKEYLEAFRKYLAITNLVEAAEKSQAKGGIVSDIAYQKTRIAQERAEISLKEGYVTYLHLLDDLSRGIGSDITPEAVKTIAQCSRSGESG